MRKAFYDAGYKYKLKSGLPRMKAADFETIVMKINFEERDQIKKLSVAEADECYRFRRLFRHIPVRR